MTAVYAGPLLDILIAVPTGFWVLLEARPGNVASAHLSPVVAAAGIMLVVHSVATLVIAKVNNGFLPRWFGRVALATYVVYLVIVVVMIMR